MKQTGKLTLVTAVYPLLENYVQECKANGDVFTKIEDIRFQLLQTACVSSDYFYIAFHQVLCLWFADRDFLKHTVAQSGQNHNLLHNGLCYMFEFLSEQSAVPVAEKHEKWFITFPFDFHQLRQSSKAYTTAVKDVATSLILIAQYRDTFVAECLKRRYDPFADEVVDIFKVSSTIVQGLMLNWVSRTIIRTRSQQETSLRVIPSPLPSLQQSPIQRVVPSNATPTPQLHQYSKVIRRYLVRPTVLEALYVNTVNFKLGEENIKKIRLTGPDLHEVQHGSIMYRFRCVELAEEAKKISEDEFVLADTAWPERITVEGKDADGKPVTVFVSGRMTESGKVLPVDITKMVTRFFKKEKEKPFTLNVVLLNRSKEGGPRHALAVEEIEIVRHDLVATRVLKQKIDFKTTQDDIKRQLTMDSSELTIGLQDPCLAKMWKTPVKTEHCRHRECFDLDTWLESRSENRRVESSIHYTLDNKGAFISGVTSGNVRYVARTPDRRSFASMSGCRR